MNAHNAKSRLAAPLNTPTDLKSNATRDVAAALNLLLADTFALYVKTKNFHWHMSGPHFRDYHLLLDEQADQIHINHILSDSSRARGPRRPARAAQATIDRTPSNEMRMLRPPRRRRWTAISYGVIGNDRQILQHRQPGNHPRLLRCTVHFSVGSRTIDFRGPRVVRFRRKRSFRCVAPGKAQATIRHRAWVRNSQRDCQLRPTKLAPTLEI